jgi:hypothetical protein
LTGGVVNMPTFALRIGTGLGTSVLGLLTGTAANLMRTLTVVASIAFGVVQLASLGVTAYHALSTPATFLELVPSVVAMVAGLVMAVSTAQAGSRR